MFDRSFFTKSKHRKKGSRRKKKRVERRQAKIKEEILAACLADDGHADGRVSLAQQMVEPIRRQMQYQAIGRKILMVDDLVQNPDNAWGLFPTEVHAENYFQD